jgi:hypothetical protein
MSPMGRTLRPLERKYSISERECLALVEGVRQYKHFLEHQHFTVVTDHSALKWSLLLQGFDFDVIHKPGKSHQNADVLSRIKYQDNVQRSGHSDCNTLISSIRLSIIVMISLSLRFWSVTLLIESACWVVYCPG